MEQIFEFTPEEKSEAFAILNNLKAEIGDSIKPDDEKTIVVLLGNIHSVFVHLYLLGEKINANVGTVHHMRLFSMIKRI